MYVAPRPPLSDEERRSVYAMLSRIRANSQAKLENEKKGGPMFRRKWGVYALYYDGPKLVNRYWTKRGAEASARAWDYQMRHISGLYHVVREIQDEDKTAQERLLQQLDKTVYLSREHFESRPKD